jgi:uncharacterized protein (DUF433 family)
MKKRSADVTIDLRELPAYALSEAAHYLRIPPVALRSWIGGRPSSKASARKDTALIELPDPKLEALSFMNLVEAHVLNALRREYRSALPQLGRALEQVRENFGWKHSLAQQRFETDALNLFISKLATSKSVSEQERCAMHELIKTHLRRIEYDITGTAMRLFPFTRDNGLDQPKIIVIDPLVSFGRPTITGSGITTRILAERYQAGDSVEALAEDYGYKQTQIEEALRCEVGLGGATADLSDRRDARLEDSSGGAASGGGGSKGLSGFIFAWAGGS